MTTTTMGEEGGRRRGGGGHAHRVARGGRRKKGGKEFMMERVCGVEGGGVPAAVEVGRDVGKAGAGAVEARREGGEARRR